MKKLLPMLALVLFTSAANADAKKTADAITNWISTEKSKTIEFQKIKWQEGKDQLANNWNTILEFFTSK